MRDEAVKKLFWVCSLVSLIALLFLPLSDRTSAATLEVDDDGTTPYQTIQSAIDFAFPGVDDVFVRCGTYSENIEMRDMVSVTGENSGCVIIDGGQAGSVVSAIDVGSGTTLEGFTIRNGQSGLGGGIYLETSSLLITRNVISGNSATITGALTGYGGGIHITSTVAARSSAAPVITRNIICENSAEKYGGGIEVYMDDGAIISNNLIEANTAVEGGGGIDSFISFPTIINNTIVRNCLQGAGTACAQGGGGILFTDSAVVEIANNVIVWNESAIGGGGVDKINSTLNFVANDTYGNAPEDYSSRWDPTGSDGNISLDPLFISQELSANAYQPRSDSPLVDAATAILAPANDLRGIPRPQDGDANGTPQDDIGARENEGLTRLEFISDTELNWDSSMNPAASFNLYRGDLDTLLDTGVYTQDPDPGLGARRWCDLGSPSSTDVDEPLEQQVFFYLPVVKNSVEGSLGFTSTPSERTFTDPYRCP